MLGYTELTRRGQSLRLAALGRSVLAAEFGLIDARVRVVSAHSFNTVFRVDTPNGLRAALRIGAEQRIHSTGVEDVEAAWLDHLAASDLVAPRNLPTSDGRRWTLASSPHIPGTRVCTLFSWVDGVGLQDRLSTKAMRNAGRLLARLHQLTAGMRIGAAGEMLRADRAIYFTDKDLVSTHQHRDRALFAEAASRVQSTLDALWLGGGEPRLLHGDFGPHNILTMRGTLRPIDFQDLRVGYPIQDLGLTIADLSWRDPSLITPFTQGYGEIEPTPDMSPKLLDLLAAARSLNIMNLGLHAPNSGIAAAFPNHAERVRHWMSATV